MPAREPGPLWTIVVAQFLAMGLWFSGTAVVADLEDAWGLGRQAAAALSYVTVLGFVLGTVCYAVWNLPDRFPPQNVFLASALVGAGAMALFVLRPGGTPGALLLRGLTGFCLAGVYPVGMKLLASWYKRLGWTIGLLVGALTLGSGSPYLIRALGLPWQAVILTSSGLAAVGGVLVAWRVRPGPLLPPRAPFDPSAFARAFRVRAFRRSALGYFGHMWELYALWGLLPLFLLARGDLAAGHVASLTFGMFASGAAACVAAGRASIRWGEARVATLALLLSAAACLASPLAFTLPVPQLVPFVLAWGAAAVADSAQFSALSAHGAPRAYVGTALTIQNAIGFALTCVPLALVPVLAGAWGWQWAFLVLAPGPLLGALAVGALASPPVAAADAAPPQ